MRQLSLDFSGTLRQIRLENSTLPMSRPSGMLPFLGEDEAYENNECIEYQ